MEKLQVISLAKFKAEASKFDMQTSGGTEVNKFQMKTSEILDLISAAKADKKEGFLSFKIDNYVVKFEEIIQADLEESAKVTITFYEGEVPEKGSDKLKRITWIRATL